MHVATHGFALEGEPGGARGATDLARTGLALAGSNHDPAGLLSARDILGLPLDSVELAFLSACNTAIGSGLAGERFASLQAAFRLAGADRVVATIWPIDDRGAAAFAERFFAADPASGSAAGIAGAIVQAQRDMLASDGFAHPFYWAGYTSFDALDSPQARFARIASRELARPVRLRPVTSLLPTVLVSFEDGRPMDLDELNALSRRFVELVPPLHRPMVIGFELGDGRLARAFGGEDRLYPLTGVLHRSIEAELSALRAAGSTSRDIELMELALAQLRMPVPASVGRERREEVLPDVSLADARADFERVLASSVARGFRSRGFAATAAQAAFALHEIAGEGASTAALRDYATALRAAGIGTAGVVFTDTRVGRELPRLWLSRCARATAGITPCLRSEYVVLEFDVNADGETEAPVVVETSDRRFGQFVQRRLAREGSPLRMLPLAEEERAESVRKARFFWAFRIAEPG